MSIMSIGMSQSWGYDFHFFVLLALACLRNYYIGVFAKVKQYTYSAKFKFPWQFLISEMVLLFSKYQISQYNHRHLPQHRDTTETCVKITIHQ